MEGVRWHRGTLVCGPVACRKPWGEVLDAEGVAPGLYCSIEAPRLNSQPHHLPPVPSVSTACLVMPCCQTGRYAAGVARFDFDRELAPYDLNRYGQWVSLSNHITQAVLKQLLPVSDTACSTRLSRPRG